MVPAVSYEAQPPRAYRPTPLGDFLRHYREEHGLTQEELAAKLGRGRTALAGWEFGRGVSVKNRDHIAKILGVKPDVLGPAWDPQQPRSAYRRRILDSHGQGVDTLASHGVSSAPPYLKEYDVPDTALFRKLVGYWQAMEPDQRQQLVSTAYDLARPTLLTGSSGVERTAKHSRG